MKFIQYCLCGMLLYEMGMSNKRNVSCGKLCVFYSIPMLYTYLSTEYWKFTHEWMRWSVFRKVYLLFQYIHGKEDNKGAITQIMLYIKEKTAVSLCIPFYIQTYMASLFTKNNTEEKQ